MYLCIYMKDDFEDIYPLIIIKGKMRKQPRGRTRISFSEPITQARKEFPEAWMFINNIM